MLAVGVVGVEGEFASHQVVSLQDETGLEFGRGVVHFSSQELHHMLGKTKTEVAERFGVAVANLEVVHRSKLFLSGEEVI